jgi:hypothetical protein
MRIARQIQLPDLKSLEGKVSPSVMEFLMSLYGHLQAYNKQVQETISGNTKSGTEIIDNGTARITKVYKEGRLISVTAGASSGATLSWTDA